ncbi:MAG: photosystem I reaction center subunit PsaK [Pseudanabaenaceae cyanobacterium bins.39]|nr:photosystem I reaction center subunit PsaK [Pseudanabaenaceae cyanobacterium bins.39]
MTSLLTLHLSTNLMALVPATASWSTGVALIMLTTNLFALVVGRYGIKVKGVGPNLPIALPGLFSGFGIPELLAVTSFGHVLGAGMILGLAQAGLL